MTDQIVVKISGQDVLAHQAVLFVLTYIKVYKNLFGNYNGYRKLSVKSCFRTIDHLLPIPLKNLQHLDTNEVFPRDKYTECAEGYDPSRHGYYNPPFWIFPNSERSAVQTFVNRFNTNGVTIEMETLEKPIQEWILCQEMARAKKAISLLKARTHLYSFRRKYPELKHALEKI